MKPLRITDADKQMLVDKFAKQLNGTKLVGNTFSFTHTFGITSQKKEVEVCFSTLAWKKMTMLVDNFTTEVGWHGTVERIDDENFYITVKIDEEEYAKWMQKTIMEQGYETYSSIKFQGHSHVNMGVTPSGTDIQHQDDIVNTMAEDSFYIFLIMNKSRSIWCSVFDGKTNAIYENTDVKVTYETDELDDWLQEVKPMVVTKTYYPTYQSSKPQTQTGNTNKPKTEEKPSKETSKKKYNSIYEDEMKYGYSDEEWDAFIKGYEDFEYDVPTKNYYR